MSRHSLSGIVMRLSSVGILLGLAGMLQPFTLELFRPGLIILLASTLLFMIAAHMAEPSSAVNAMVVEEMPTAPSQPIRPDNP